jgi:hypothetical protein
MGTVARRLLVVGVSALLGLGAGRLLVPRLEPFNEITVIVRARDNHCFFNTSSTQHVLGRATYLVDGGERLECNERWRLSDRSSIYCECD